MRNMCFGFGLAIVSLAPILSACTSVPLTSVPKLASLDAETMDLREVELAVRMQDDFDIVQDSAAIFVSLRHKETGDSFGETFILAKNDQPLTPSLTRKLKRGYTIHRFEMDPETSEAIMIHRDKVVSKRKAEPGRHEGTFSANVGLCLTRDGNPFIDPRMTLFLRVADDEDFFTMIKETKVPLPKDEDEQPRKCDTNESPD